MPQNLSPNIPNHNSNNNLDMFADSLMDIFTPQASMISDSNSIANKKITTEDNAKKILKIGVCGAHGTGKTTLANSICKSFGIPIITNLMRSFWQEHGVIDFEKLPKDVRTIFQKESLLRQIKAEDDSELGFITDRTALDQLGYTKLSSNMQGVEFKLYEQLCKERLQNYSHLIYLPIEFDVQSELLRANIETRDILDKIMKHYLDLWMPNKYTVISGDFERRLTQVNLLLES